MEGETQNTCRHRFFFYISSGTKRLPVKTVIPFTEKSQALTPTKKKKKKIESISTAILWSYKDAVDIFVVGKFLIS